MSRNAAHDRSYSSSASTRIDDGATHADRVTPGLAIPLAEILLVARFGPSMPRGFEVHALGIRERVHRKLVRGGHRIATVRLPLGAQEAVLGVRASAIEGHPVPLGELWGDAATRRLFDRLEGTSTAREVAVVLEGAVAERLALDKGSRANRELAVHAATKLVRQSVSEVARALSVSERNLRRVFRDTLGVGPKTFARLERFRRALGAARATSSRSWVAIAMDAGYYDQAHMIAEFKAIAGVTPQALLEEMRSGFAIG